MEAISQSPSLSLQPPGDGLFLHYDVLGAIIGRYNEVLV